MRQPHEFAIHMGAGLNNGLTLKSRKFDPGAAIRWLSCHRNSTGCCCRVIKEHGLDVDENYAGHRGLL